MFEGPGPAQVCKTHERSFKNQEIDLLGNMMQNRIENEEKMLPKRCHNGYKEYPEKISKIESVLSSIFVGFGLPKEGSKSDFIYFLRCLFGSWGPSGSKKRPQGLQKAILQE